MAKRNQREESKGIESANEDQGEESVVNPTPETSSAPIQLEGDTQPSAAEQPVEQAPIEQPPVTPQFRPLPSGLVEAPLPEIARPLAVSMHTLGQVVDTPDGDGIVVSLAELRKFMCGLITNVQPNGITSQFVGVAGKIRFTRDILGQKTKDDQDAAWARHYGEYSRR